MRIGGREAAREKESMICGDDKNQIKLNFTSMHFTSYAYFSHKKIPYYISPDYLNDRDFKYFLTVLWHHVQNNSSVAEMRVLKAPEASEQSELVEKMQACKEQTYVWLETRAQSRRHWESNWSDTQVTQKPLKQWVADIMVIILLLKYLNLCLG